MILFIDKCSGKNFRNYIYINTRVFLLEIIAFSFLLLSRELLTDKRKP